RFLQRCYCIDHFPDRFGRPPTSIRLDAILEEPFQCPPIKRLRCSATFSMVRCRPEIERQSSACLKRVATQSPFSTNKTNSKPLSVAFARPSPCRNSPKNETTK